MKNELKLISMSEIQIENVQWLWYPYIPLGKLTIVQGDPGEGKTSFVLAVISALTRGDPLPECEEAAEPVNVIYQTAEDGLADTIKPRLEMVGADCSRVLVIDDSSRELTLFDDRLEQRCKKTPRKILRFCGERRHSGVSESCRLRRDEGYGACADEVRGPPHRSHEQGPGAEVRLPRPRLYRLPRGGAERSAGGVSAN